MPINIGLGVAIPPFTQDGYGVGGTVSNLLLETGDNLLLETGSPDVLLLE